MNFLEAKDRILVSTNCLARSRKRVRLLGKLCKRQRPVIVI